MEALLEGIAVGLGCGGGERDFDDVLLLGDRDAGWRGEVGDGDLVDPGGVDGEFEGEEFRLAGVWVGRDDRVGGIVFEEALGRGGERPAAGVGEINEEVVGGGAGGVGVAGAESDGGGEGGILLGGGLADLDDAVVGLGGGVGR